MFRIKEILSLQVQFVFLSGTVPLHIEQAFKDVFNFKELALIRGLTTRDDIAYKCKQYNSNVERQQFLEIKEYINNFFINFLTPRRAGIRIRLR